MSASGQSRRFGTPLLTSGLPLLADIRGVRRHVRKVPHPEMLVSRLGHRMRPPLLFHCARAIKYARSRISASEIGCVTSAIEASYPGRVLLLVLARVRMDSKESRAAPPPSIAKLGFEFNVRRCCCK